MCIAKGSLILLSRLLVAGTVFIVEQKTEGWAPYTCSPPGSVILGCLMGSDGMMLRASIMFTGCSSGTAAGPCKFAAPLPCAICMPAEGAAESTEELTCPETGLDCPVIGGGGKPCPLIGGGGKPCPVIGGGGKD